MFKSFIYFLSSLVLVSSTLRGSFSNVDEINDSDRELTSSATIASLVKSNSMFDTLEAALEAAGHAFEGGLHHLHLVVDQERTQRRTEDGGHLEGECLEHDADVAPVADVHPEDAGHREQETDDHEHGGRPVCCMGETRTNAMRWDDYRPEPEQA